MTTLYVSHWNLDNMMNEIKAAVAQWQAEHGHQAQIKGGDMGIWVDEAVSVSSQASMRLENLVRRAIEDAKTAMVMANQAKIA
jgi:hypothetical protein